MEAGDDPQQNREEDNVAFVVDDVSELMKGWQYFAFLILIIICAQLNCWYENRRQDARAGNKNE